MAICQPWANYASAASVGHRVIGVSSKQQWPGWWWVGGCYCTWFSGNFRIDDAWWFHGVLPSCLKGRPPAAGNSRGSVVRVVRSVNFQGEWSLWRAPGVLAGAFRGLTSSNKRPRKITNGNGVSMVGNPWLSTCNRVVTPAVGMTWFSLKLCSWGIQVPHRPKAVESLHSGGASIISLKMPGAQDFLLVQQRSKCGWLLNTGVLSFLQ